MEADEIRRLESAIANLEHHVSDLRRAVNPMADLLRGAQSQTVQTPSGIPGFNKQWQVPAVTLGDVPADEGAAGSFQCSYAIDANGIGKTTVGSGSYEHPLGTNTDVGETGPSGGKFVYAVIQQTESGGLGEFKIEITSVTKDAINMSADGTFVEFSNVLIAEVVGDAIIQRRVGNLSLIYRMINGAFCLWPETTGGSSL